MNECRKFWMVLGCGTPTVRHESEPLARREAERLAMQHPGQEFTVMESVATVMKTAVTWRERIDDPYLPF